MEMSPLWWIVSALLCMLAANERSRHDRQIINTPHGGAQPRRIPWVNTIRPSRTF